MISKRNGLLAGALLVLVGCAGPGGHIPVVDAGRNVSNETARVGAGRQQQMPPAQAPRQEGDAVVVMVPDDAGGSRPVQSFPLDAQPSLQTGSAPAQPSSSQPWDRPPAASPGGGLQADEQLDGPVLALLTVAREQEGRGDLGSASASLERAMRIAPREPQVLYRLAQVRLAQGDAAQAEQLAQRGLSHAAGRPTLQAGLWDLVAQARERQGNAAGAAEARRQASVTL
jgi:predicted Zn-dependent protease